MSKLSFKGISSSWEDKPLNKCSEFIKDGTHASLQNSKVGKPLLSAKDIYDQEIHIAEDCRIISQEDYDLIYSNYNLAQDDILLTIVGTFGRTAIVTKDTPPVALQRSVAIIRPNKIVINPMFMVQSMNKFSFQDELIKKQNKGAQGGIYLGVLGNIEIKIPKSVQEQEKIATLLSGIDEKIKKQKLLIKKLEDTREAIFVKMFPKDRKMTPELRFKKNDGSHYSNWDEKRIEEVCKIQTGGGNTQDKEDFAMYPFYVRSPIIEHSSKYIFDCEAVLTVGDGVGVGNVYHYVNGKFNCHQRVYAMNEFKDVIGKYFYYYFSRNFGKRVRSMSAKTSVDSVRRDMIADMMIKFPKDKEEQEKIASYFSNIDELIRLNQQKYEKLCDVKKALLSKLLQ